MQAKTILITGANSGIGFLAARSLVKMGANVLVATRSIEKSRETATRIPGSSPVEAPLELNNLKSVRKFASHVKYEYGNQLNTVVHNAGVFLSEDARDTLTINALSPSYLSSLLGDGIERTVCVITSPQAQHSIGIPNIDDLEGKRICTGVLSRLKTYIHSKQVLSCVMTHQAQALKQKVILLAPGAVDTGIHRKLRSDINFITRILLYFQSFKYHGTPEWAAESVVLAATGEFDSSVEDSISVVDLGNLVTSESYVTDYNANASTNCSIYEAVLEEVNVCINSSK